MIRSGLVRPRLLSSLGAWGLLPTGARMRLRSTANVLAILCYEYRRAVAAERHYEKLHRADRHSRSRAGVAKASITRRVFVEMYSDRCTSSDRS
jgi:hypothetical protein